MTQDPCSFLDMDYGINDLYTSLLIINSTIINMGYNKLIFYSHELDYRKKLAKKNVGEKMWI